LRHYLALTPAEEDALARLEEHERKLPRGAVVRREHDRARELFVLRKGWIYSSVGLDDGSRQILKLSFPGDLLGHSVIAFSDAPDTLCALTDVTICPFDRLELRNLFERHPRLAALIMAVMQAEQVALTDRLASLGRTSARARVAALLLDILTRLRLMKPDQHRDSFPLTLTQEQIGDATGLTAVHVNRMIRSLEEEGLIRRGGGAMRILDEQRLTGLANYIDRSAEIDTSWLPNSTA